MPTKRENGVDFGPDAFLHVPDAEAPGTWKLRIQETPGTASVAQFGRAAAALGPGFRGQRVELSDKERKAAARKLIAAYRSEKVRDSEVPGYLFELGGMSARAGKAAISLVNLDTGSLVELLYRVDDLSSELRDVLGAFGINPYDEGADAPEVAEPSAMMAAFGAQSIEDVKSLPDVDAALCIKELGAGRIGGHAVLWGDSELRDLSAEWFDRGTAELTEIFKTMGGLPWLYKHGMDSAMRTQVVGVVDVLEEDELGLWYEAQLNESAKYRDLVLRLVRAGKLGTSSGTLPGARKVAPNGHIERWPIVEVSGTPAPMEHRMLERPVAEIEGAFEQIGMVFEAADPGGGAVEARSLALQLERLHIAALEHSTNGESR